MAVLVEAEQALVTYQGFDRGGFRRQHFNGDAIVLADLLDEPVGLGMQAPGVQAEDLDLLVQLPGHVDQHHIFGAAEGYPQVIAEVLESELEDVLRGLAGIGRGEGGDVEGLAHASGFLMAGCCVHLCRRAMVAKACYSPK